MMFMIIFLLKGRRGNPKSFKVFHYLGNPLLNIHTIECVRNNTLLWLNTSCIKALCFRSFLDFIIRTMAAWRYIFLSSSTAWWVASISCGVSFCTVPAILNLVLLLLYLRWRLEIIFTHFIIHLLQVQRDDRLWAEDVRVDLQKLSIQQGLHIPGKGMYL